MGNASAPRIYVFFFGPAEKVIETLAGLEQSFDDFVSDLFSGKDQISNHPHFIGRSMFPCLQCLPADIQTHFRHSGRFVCSFFCPQR